MHMLLPTGCVEMVLCRLCAFFLASTPGFGSKIAIAIRVEVGEISLCGKKIHLSLIDSDQNKDL